MNREQIIEYLGQDWSRMQSNLHSGLASDVLLLQSTNDTLLSHSGKCVRPMILLLIANALGQPSEDSALFAAACEMLHNATLMHDDVADESSQRRGRPTVAALLGPTAAVLLGDFWLARAVDLVLKSSNFAKVIPLFAAVLTKLAEGEMLQMEKASECNTTEADYLRIIDCKTASLFEVAGSTAAISVTQRSDYYDIAVKYARAYGIAFQIKDDILDYAGTSELGKPLGADIREQKITLPLLGAMYNAGPQAEAAMRDKIRNIHLHPELANEANDFVKHYGGVEYAAARLDSCIEDAVNAIGALPSSQAVDFLVDLARYNSFRQL